MAKSELPKDGSFCDRSATSSVYGTLILEANFVSKLARSTKWSHTGQMGKASQSYACENGGALRATPWTNVAQHPRKLETQQLSPLKLKKRLQKLEKNNLAIGPWNQKFELYFPY